MKKSVVHVKQHLSAFMAASILASAAGFEDDYETEDKQQGWSSMILFVVFYGAYFGIVIGAWEALRLGMKKLLERIGMGRRSRA